MTARLMGDSTIPSAIPSWVAIKCFYVDGKYAAPQSVINDWHGPKVLINVTGDPSHGGDMIDVEAEDAGPDAIPNWYDQRKTDGAKYLGVYCSRDPFAACTAALNGRKAARWLATLDGTVLRMFGGIELTAVQAFPAAWMPTNFDLSIVFDPEWHPGVLPGRIRDIALSLDHTAQLLNDQNRELRMALAELSPPA